MLCENLPCPPAKVYGRLLDTWRREEWTNLFREHDVVVCTAAVLHQCLSHAYTKIEDINLIIFDEAHHAKKEHEYAQ
jgi:endoribonuclease Dicer